MSTHTAEFEDGKTNITSLGRLFNRHRDTIRKYIKDYGIESTDRVNGQDVYSVELVAKALFGHTTPANDPDSMSTFERKEFFMGELKRLDLEEREGQLCKVEEVREEFAEVFRMLGEAIASFPDLAERDYGASPEVLEYIDILCDRLQILLAGKVAGDD